MSSESVEAHREPLVVEDIEGLERLIGEPERALAHARERRISTPIVAGIVVVAALGLGAELHSGVDPLIAAVVTSVPLAGLIGFSWWWSVRRHQARDGILAGGALVWIAEVELGPRTEQYPLSDARGRWAVLKRGKRGRLLLTASVVGEELGRSQVALERLLEPESRLRFARLRGPADDWYAMRRLSHDPAVPDKLRALAIEELRARG